MKLCKKCDKYKPFTEMVKNKNCADGYEPKCKLCLSLYNKEYRLINKIIKPKRTPIDIKETEKQYYIKNKTKINKTGKEWRDNNKESSKVKRRKYILNKKNTDSLFKLKENIKGSIRQSFKERGYRKNCKTIEILGCSFEEFKTYIETQFLSWMNWTNHGNWNGIPSEINIAWDIDHIVPLSSAKTEKDIIRLNHFSNFQPLCSYTNRWIKKDNI